MTTGETHRASTSVTTHSWAGDLVSGPALEFPDRMAAPEGVTLIDDAGMLKRHFRGWTSEEIPDRTPMAAVLVDGQAVSLCACARRSSEAAEASLETAEPLSRAGPGRTSHSGLGDSSTRIGPTAVCTAHPGRTRPRWPWPASWVCRSTRPVGASMRSYTRTGLSASVQLRRARPEVNGLRLSHSRLTLPRPRA